VCKGAAPANNPARCNPLGRGLNEIEGNGRAHHIGSFPGAACFCTLRLHQRWDENCEGALIRAKAATLQAVGTASYDEFDLPAGPQGFNS
jgi:hypothetical protein